ncbi:hypothetical protein F5Y15DRAFT_275705 [Xylariaceae sp. FL0016]|nr:hypothetical protein F5Y15DRAFT_275705 [Xylariaceae sp. FL0016]
MAVHLNHASPFCKDAREATMATNNRKRTPFCFFDDFNHIKMKAEKDDFQGQQFWFQSWWQLFIITLDSVTTEASQPVRNLDDLLRDYCNNVWNVLYPDQEVPWSPKNLENNRALTPGSIPTIQINGIDLAADSNDTALPHKGETRTKIADMHRLVRAAEGKFRPHDISQAMKRAYKRDTPTSTPAEGAAATPDAESLRHGALALVNRYIRMVQEHFQGLRAGNFSNVKPIELVTIRNIFVKLQVFKGKFFPKAADDALDRQWETDFEMYADTFFECYKDDVDFARETQRLVGRFEKSINEMSRKFKEEFDELP